MTTVINGTTGITTDGLVTPALTYNGSTAPGLFQDENRIINGAFDFWQRGTSQTTFGYGSADRWVNIFVGGTVTQSRQSFTLGDTLGNNSPTYFLRQTVSGQSLASHVAVTDQRIEGVRSYAGQTVTILGWARRSSGAGNMVVSVQQVFGTGGTPSANVDLVGQTITLTGSWAPFAATLAVPSITGKTLGSNGDDYLTVRFWTSAGSDYSTLTNSLGLQTIGVDLWGIHIKLGTHTTAAVDLYKQPELGPELARCQRYYFAATNVSFGFVASAASQDARATYTFPSSMRTAPTVSWSGGTTGNASTAASANATAQNTGLRVVSSAAGLAYRYDGSLTADAEL